jgi:plasmid stabilization system protein ParE
VKPVRIAPPASDEFTEAIRWYERKRAGLGGEFYDAVGRATDLIREHPAIGLSVEVPANHRQLMVDRFPFKVVYRERADDIYIVAIAHSSRRPGYWRDRR